MSIRKHLDAILEGAANRPADKLDGETAVPSALEDETKKGAFGAATKRKADKAGELADREGTKIVDPTAAQSQGDGTEVQGNTDTHQGLGEDIATRISAKLNEESEFKFDSSRLKGLLESQELAEEFQAEAVEIFEAAINDAAAAHLGRINEAAAEIIESELETSLVAMEAEIEDRVNATVAEWLEENKIAVQSGIRTEIAESFMEGLKGLLESHYIELPEEKADLYEHAIEKGQETLDLYEAALAKGQELLEENQALQKALVMESVVAGLPETQAEKLRSLSESVEFTDEESFIGKINRLKEGYVKASVDADSLTEDTLVVETVSEEVDADVAAIAAGICRYKTQH